MRVGAAVLLVELLLASPAFGATLSDARSAYDRNHVAEAERMFAAVASDPTASADDRSAAMRELARIAWLIDADPKRALQHLIQAGQVGGKPCETSEMTARVLRESGQAKAALSKASELLNSCAEPAKLDVIRTHLIEARLDLATKGGADRARLLAGAMSEGEKLGAVAGLEGASARLETALLAGDAGAALAAWKDFYWLEESDAPPALAGWGVTQIIADGLKPGASADQRLKLADLLMHAGFAEAARRYAAAYGLPGAASASPAWRRLQAYWQVRDMVEATLLKVNRGLARGKRDDKSIETAVAQGMAILMQAAGVRGEPRAVLLESYGMVGTGAGTTGGYPSLHLGHLVEDRRDRVSQYGKSAEIRFQSIDNMIGNGFESWLWDGSAGVGGWTANGVIVQVRPRYVAGPMRAEQYRHDSPARRELLAKQPAKAAEDIAKLRAKPVATLDGLSDRLQLQVVDRVDAVARSKAKDEEGVRRAFLAEFARANFDQSIYVHEGRHAIDAVVAGDKKVDQVTLEYQAKLSELALAAYPRMALRNMNRSLEGDGPHDKAGARIFDEYRKWMESHRGELIGYDPAVAALAQLDKLTDMQLREVARALDPLAPKSN